MCLATICCHLNGDVESASKRANKILVEAVKFSPSLSVISMTEWNPDNMADPGIWQDLDWTQPPPTKKAKKSLSLKLKRHHKSTDSDQLASPDKSLDSYQQQIIPENTGEHTMGC